MINWLVKNAITIILILLGIFIFYCLVYTIILLRRDPQLANAYVATGTLILAGATILLAVLSWQSIKSGYDREKRGRREQRLKEVTDWAIDILSCGYEESIVTFEWQSLTLKEFELIFLDHLHNRFSTLSSRSSYIWRIALPLDKDLAQAVLITTLTTARHLKLLNLARAGKIKNRKSIGKHRTLLNSNATDIIEKATKLL